MRKSPAVQISEIENLEKQLKDLRESMRKYKVNLM